MIREYKQDDKGSALVTMDWGEGQVHIVVGNGVDTNCVTLSEEAMMEMILDLTRDVSISKNLLLRKLVVDMNIWEMRAFAKELLEMLKNSEELPEWAKEL